MVEDRGRDGDGGIAFEISMETVSFIQIGYMA